MCEDSESSEDTEDATDSDLSSELEQIHMALEALPSVPAYGNNGANVKIYLQVNKVPRVAVADSGAAMAMCGTKDMEECGLTITDEVRQFKGLGRAEARKARPALLDVLGKTLQVEFFVVDQRDFPMLIGVQELRALNVVVDPVTQCLRDPSALGVYSVEERQYLEEKQTAAPDLAGHEVTS